MSADSIPSGSAAAFDPVVSIVILANRVDAFQRCVASITATADSQTAPYEVIALFQDIDSDGLDAYLESEPAIRGIHVRLPIGTAPGFNLAARRAKGKYLVFLRDGSRVSSGWLRHLVATVESNPNIAVVGSRIADSKGAIREAGVTMFSDGTEGAPRRESGNDGAGGVRDVDGVSVDGLLVRADAFAAVGGFDERYRPDGMEDRDLCFAIANVLRQRIVCDERSIVLRDAESGRDAALERFRRERLRAAFCAKWKDVLAAAPSPPYRGSSQSPHTVPPSAKAPDPAPRGAAVRAERRADETKASDDLAIERSRAEASETMLIAADRHVTALERRTIELEKIVGDLQFNIDVLQQQLAQEKACND